MAGFLGSMHCVGMCGGIVSALSVVSSKENPMRTNVLFNSGRVLSYTLIGGIAGASGKLIGNMGNLHVIRGFFNVAVGIIMILLAVELLGWLRVFKPDFGLIKRLLPIVKAGGWKGSFGLGGLMGIVPCGLTYAVYVNSLSSGSFAHGAVFAFAFAMGTVPAILGVGTITGTWSGDSRKVFTSMSVCIIVIMAFFSISSGIKSLNASMFTSGQMCCHSKGF